MTTFISQSSSYSNSFERFGNQRFGLDPVTKEQMKHPIIDQRGHTFDLSTIERLAKESMPVICPIGGEEIDLEHLVPNFIANEAIDHSNELFNKFSQVIGQIDGLAEVIIKNAETHGKQIDELKSQNQTLMKLNVNDREQSSKEIALLTQDIKSMKTAVDTLTIENRGLKISNKKLIDQNKNLIDFKELSNKNITDLKKEVKTSRQQIQNIAEMGAFDRLYIALGSVIPGKSNHLNRVMNRGIDELNSDDKALLNSKEGI